LLLDLTKGSKKTTAEAVVYLDLQGNRQLSSFSTVDSPPVCPVCPQLVVISNGPGCFGGPKDGCGCCMNTGEVVNGVAPSPPDSEVFMASTTQYKLCGAQPGDSCQTYANYFQCLNGLAQCIHAPGQVKPYLCGTCSEA